MRLLVRWLCYVVFAVCIVICSPVILVGFLLSVLFIVPLATATWAFGDQSWRYYYADVAKDFDLPYPESWGKLEE